MVVFMKVTRDRYKLPIAIADSIPEFARITGSNENTIRSVLSHAKTKKSKRSIYQKVEIGVIE